MAVSKSRIPSRKLPHEPQTEIVIERREVVGTIQLGGSGKPGLVVAFEKMGEYIGENWSSGGIQLGFELEGRHFQAILHPDPLVDERHQGIPDDGPDFD